MVDSDKKMRKIVRIMSTDIFGHKPLYKALTQIKGISFMYSNAVCKASGLPKGMLIGELSDEQVKLLEETITHPSSKGIPAWLLNRKRDPETGEDAHLVMSTLKLRTEFDLRDMKKIKSYKGMRHSVGLPVRGQRTRSNFRRGKSLGVQKKKVKK